MSTNKTIEILKRNALSAADQKKRNRKILSDWNHELLKFMDEVREEFGEVKVLSIWCDVEIEGDTHG